MTTKKTIIIVVSIVVVLGLIVLIFIGGIVGAVFYGIGNSEAANVSKEFLKSNEQLKRDIGEVKDFGSFITGNINVKNGDGTAELSLKVIGERKTVNASVELMYRSGHQWRVTAASFKNEAGETIDLLNPYESHKQFPVKQTVSLRSFEIERSIAFYEHLKLQPQTNSLLYFRRSRMAA